MNEVTITYTGKQNKGLEVRLANLMHKCNYRIKSFTRTGTNQELHYIITNEDNLK